MRYPTLSLLFLLMSCAPEGDDLEDLAASEQALESTSLANGTYTPIANVVGAENQLFTSTGQLLVSGDEGIFAISKSSTGIKLTTVIAKQAQCKFGGLAEANGWLYANCYDTFDSYLYAAKLGGSFTQIAKFAGRGLINGLTADAQGRLYLTSTLSDEITRLIPSTTTPRTIVRTETFVKPSGSLSNGIDFYNGSVYWTDSINIKTSSVSTPSSTTVVTDFAYFDDLEVDASGILVADFTAGVLRAYDLKGKPTGTSPHLFNGPSSVDRALGRAGFSAKALIVTERLANRVSVYDLL